MGRRRTIREEPITTDQWVGRFVVLPRKKRVELRRPGRTEWLDWMATRHREVLVQIIRDLEKYPYLLTTGILLILMKRMLSLPTLLSFLRRYGVEPVKDPVMLHPVRGYCRVSLRIPYYDPGDVCGVLLGKLNDLGDDRAQTLPAWDDRAERLVPYYEGKYRNNALRDRWTRDELELMIASADDYGQWIMPAELSWWLQVTKGTLYKWRRMLDESKDRQLYPPYVQAPDLIPSCARSPTTGLVGVDMLNHRRGQYDPVLYNRDQVVRWLEGLLSRR